MIVRFFNGNDPRAPAETPKEVLMIGLSPDHCPAPELHEAVRVATEADLTEYAGAYADYETAQQVKQEAEKAAGQQPAPGDLTLKPEDAKPEETKPDEAKAETRPEAARPVEREREQHQSDRDRRGR